jgi:hypothetical protein
MKKSELKQLIREEIYKTLNEVGSNINPEEFKNWSKWKVDFYENENNFSTVYYDLMDNLDFKDKLKQALNKALNEYDDFGDSLKDKLIFFVYNDELYPNYKEVEVARWSRSNGLDIMVNEI